MKYSLAEVAKGLATNQSLSKQMQTNLASLSEVLPTDSTTKIRVDTFHEKNVPVEGDIAAMDVVRYAAKNMAVVVEPTITDDMDESQRILATVEAQEQTVRNQAVLDSVAFIGCDSYNPDGSCATSGDGIL